VPGDVLRMIGPSPVEARDNDDLAVVRRRLSELKPGSNVELKLDRNGSQVSVKVVPEAWAQTDDFEVLFDLWGVSIKPLTVREAAKRGLKEGKGFFVSYVDPTGRAAEAGLTIGDIVVAIENDSPTTKEEIEKLYQRLSGDKNLSSIFFKVMRSGFVRCFLVKNSQRIRASEGQGQ